MRKKVEISDAYKLKKNQKNLPSPKNDDYIESDELTPIS